MSSVFVTLHYNIYVLWRGVHKSVVEQDRKVKVQVRLPCFALRFALL